nr:hypothetical protein [Modestobacter altitudinis]
MPEWHKTDHGLHAHFALGQYVHRSVIRSTWSRGFVKGKLLSDLPVGSGTREAARVAAGYLSKYVSKTFDAPQLFGRHRYDLAQGFQPPVRRLTADSPEDLLAKACEVMGQLPTRSWSSAEVEN